MRRQKGFSLIELLIVVAIMLVIAAITIPSLLRARMSANNSGAAATMRTVNTSQATYATYYPLAGYAGQWGQLGPAAPGTSCSASAACLLDQWVACGAGSGPCNKSGYNYFINDGTGGKGGGPAPAAGTPPDTDFAVSATPAAPGLTGDGNYCSLSDVVVRSSKNAVPPVANPPVLATPGVTSTTCADITKYGPIQ